MKDLFDRVSYWFEERFAALEDRTEDVTVPTLDQAMERLTLTCEGLRERLSDLTWRRAGFR